MVLYERELINISNDAKIISVRLKKKKKNIVIVENKSLNKHALLNVGIC